MTIWTDKTPAQSLPGCDGTQLGGKPCERPLGHAGDHGVYLSMFAELEQLLELRRNNDPGTKSAMTRNLAESLDRELGDLYEVVDSFCASAMNAVDSIRESVQNAKKITRG